MTYHNPQGERNDDVADGEGATSSKVFGRYLDIYIDLVMSLLCCIPAVLIHILRLDAERIGDLLESGSVDYGGFSLTGCSWLPGNKPSFFR